MAIKKIPILYEDDDLLVVNKPAGLVVHADGKTKEKTLVDWLLKNRPETAGVGEPMVLPDGTEIPRPGVVHRLDRETSGVLVIAKTQEAYEALKQQFQSRSISKTYFAFVAGIPRADRGLIDFPIGRDPKDFRKWSAGRLARGELRPAVTQYVMRARGKGAAFLEIWPKTGRTHQIRVHLKAINHPVIGDALYGNKQENSLGFTRLALHAASIEFQTLAGKHVRVEAPFPEDFIAAKKAMEGEAVSP